MFPNQQFKTRLCAWEGCLNEFTPVHTRERYCGRCATLDFIAKSRARHGNRYDYAQTRFTKGRAKLTIICPVHGAFEQVARSHLAGYGCKKCSIDFTASLNRMSEEEFIQKAREVHQGRYSYDQVAYVSASTSVKIGCGKHGAFLQIPAKHLFGHGCNACGYESSSQKQRKTA